MGVGMKRFDVYLTKLDPTFGYEMKKARPCAIISPDEINFYLKTVILVPMTTKIRFLPTRIKTRFKNKICQLAIDQLRVIDKRKLIRKLGVLEGHTQTHLCECLQEMFSYAGAV